MGLQERVKQLKSAIEDFKSIEGFSRNVIKKYENQLKGVEAELEELKQKKLEAKESGKEGPK